MKAKGASALLPLLFAGMLATGAAANPQYRCEPGTVDNDAVAVTYDDTDVGRFSKRDEKICIFAIGGASSGSTASGASQPPWSALLQQLMQNGDIEGIVVRLTVARAAVQPDLNDVRGSILGLISESGGRQRLATCFSALAGFQTGDRPVPLITRSDEREFVYLIDESGTLSASCSVFAPGEYGDLRSDVPTLSLSVRFNDGSQDTLFVPLPAIQ